MWYKWCFSLKNAAYKSMRWCIACWMLSIKACRLYGATLVGWYQIRIFDIVNRQNYLFPCRGHVWLHIPTLENGSLHSVLSKNFKFRTPKFYIADRGVTTAIFGFSADPSIYTRIIQAYWWIKRIDVKILFGRIVKIMSVYIVWDV